MELRNYQSRGRPLEEQWFDMWNIIFPGAQKPKSVYVGSRLSEIVPMLRRLWNKRRSEIISDVAQTSFLDTLPGSFVDDVMGLVFDRFEEETATISTDFRSMERKVDYEKPCITPAEPRQSLIDQMMIGDTDCNTSSNLAGTTFTEIGNDCNFGDTFLRSQDSDPLISDDHYSHYSIFESEERDLANLFAG